MSGEGAASQPPTGSEKPRAPNPRAITSSFINKGGKTFAPKAKVVRRRPGAGAAAATAKGPAAASSEPQAARTQDEANPTPVPELPTPDATQDAPLQDARQTEQSVTETTTTLVGPVTLVPTATDVEPSTTSTPVHTENLPPTTRSVEAIPAFSPGRTKRLHLSEEESDSTPARKRQRVDTSKEPEETQTVPDGSSNAPSTSHDQGPSLTAIDRTTPPLLRNTTIAHSIETDAPPANDSATQKELSTITNEEENTNVTEASEPQTYAAERPEQSWTAVNASQDGESAPARLPTTRKRTTKRRRGAITLRQIEEEEEQGLEEEGRAPRRRKRAATRARDNSGAGEAGLNDEVENGQPAAKRTRRTRKNKDTQRATQEVEEAGDGDQNVAVEAPQPKRKRSRRTSTEQAPGTEKQSRQRGPRVREPTPSDAEHEVIDPSATYMDNLASHNIRVGKLSEREKKLRENWTEIKQRLKERDLIQEDQAEITRRLEAEADAQATAQQASGNRIDIVDGQIVIAQGSGTIDPDAAADLEREQMEVMEEDDLTNRVTNKSFMRNNKRFPKDFMLPGQGKRWNFKDTEDFYAALAMFGTDFMMISTLFPGVTRRSVKTKFVREERKNPQRIKEVLHGGVNSDWDQYLAISGHEGGSFGDPEEINRQLKEEEDRINAEIMEAKEAADEEKRQRRLAGVESDDETGDKENGKGKKEKGRKKAAKQSVFVEEEGLEILGDINEDESWGRE